VGPTVLTKLTGGYGKIEVTVEVGAEQFVSLCFILGYFPSTAILQHHCYWLSADNFLANEGKFPLEQ